MKFGKCSCKFIKTTRAKSMQKELEKICPLGFFMILGVPTKPLKGFMFQMKGCKWDFVDIKHVMQTEILFFLVYPSSRTITIEVRKIKPRPTKIAGRREPYVCRRLRLSSIAHGWMLKMEVEKCLIQIFNFGLDGDNFFFHLFIFSCAGHNYKQEKKNSEMGRKIKTQKVLEK